MYCRPMRVWGKARPIRLSHCGVDIFIASHSCLGTRPTLPSPHHNRPQYRTAIKDDTYCAFCDPLGLSEITLASTHRLAVGPPLMSRLVRCAEETVSLPTIDWYFAKVLFVRALQALVLYEAQLSVAHCEGQGYVIRWSLLECGYGEARLRGR